ncbi:glycoside hydrolase family 18 protein [Marinimicrobium sp. ARAG 43.8]|uniref:glycoside hydrolase family 18 protein n=1 Tax=Marinimicrobium sp. ARAG 43.8 TaxID=3418719 RepID=UPI003CF12A0C
MKLWTSLWALAALFIAAACSSPTTPTPMASNEDSASRIIGYFTQWGDYRVKQIHTSGSAKHLTHIVYAFGDVQNGECIAGNPDDDYRRLYSADQSVDGVADTSEEALHGHFGQFRKLKALYPHLKILWSFGGWTGSGGFGEAAENPERFARSCHELVTDPRWVDVFDGIDIDWEYPNACGLSCDESGFDAYREMMQALRAEFGQDLVTAAIGAGSQTLEAADYGGAAEYVDFYMLMTYDYFGGWAEHGPTAPHSALFDFDALPLEGRYGDASVQQLKNLGVPDDKILLGLGFYGRGWTGVNQSAPGGKATGVASEALSDYRLLKDNCPATGTVGGVAYAHCGDQWWSYDTPATIAHKMDYVRQQKLGGTFFWELSGDTTDGELIRAIAE